MDWTNFFLAAAAAAATLIGLLLIAVQFNIDMFATDPGNRWRAIARATFAVYGTLFFLPMIMLIPNLDSGSRGVCILIVVAYGIFRVATASAPFWRGVFQHRGERLWQTAWVLVGPVLAYLVLVGTAYDSFQGSTAEAASQPMAFVILGLFAIGLRNSWNLLVEVAYERKQQAGKSS